MVEGGGIEPPSDGTEVPPSNPVPPKLLYPKTQMDATKQGG